MSLIVDFTPPQSRFDIPLPVPGRAWREAPVEFYDSEHGVGLLIGNLYFTADMFHMLPEHNDWKAVKRGDIAIVGRADLDWHMLDLLDQPSTRARWAGTPFPSNCLTATVLSSPVVP